MTDTPEQGSVPRSSVATRLISVLAAFHPGDEALTLTEIARRTDLAAATALRLIRELVQEGMLERTEEGAYRIGMRLFRIGMLAPAQRGLREVALPFMQDLFQVTKENILLSVLDSDGYVLYLEKLKGRMSASALTRSGGRLPAYATATGKAILAHSDPAVIDAVCNNGFEAFTRQTISSREELLKDLELVRRRGYAVAQSELREGRVAVGAVVVNHDRSTIAALAVMGAASNIDILRVAPAVRTAALALSRRLGSPAEGQAPSSLWS